MTHLTKSEIKKADRCLRVRAKVDTRRGIGEDVIPAGSIGYVFAHRMGDETMLILWDIKRPSKYDNRMSAHPAADLETVGRGVEKV